VGLGRAFIAVVVAALAVPASGAAVTIAEHGSMEALAPLGSPVPTRAETPPGPGGSPFCEGNGQSGSRVQAVYGHLEGQPDNYAANVATIRTMAAAIDDAYDMSAARQGASAHPRWAFDQGTCNFSVLNVELPAGAADNFNLTVQRMSDLGLLARTDRKYVVWVDAEGANPLISQGNFDTDPNSATNRADGGQAQATVSQLARNGGWDTDGIGGPVIRWGPQHELAHALGAVNSSAPHSIAGGHCSDEYDAMCNGDPDNPVCGPASAFADLKILLDCNNDDYFAPNPAPGSYPASNWNIYNSSFLVRTDVPNETPEVGGLDTRLTKSKVKKRKATFEFTGTGNPPLTFECSLDGKPFAACTSPVKYKRLKRGRHTFAVRAIDATGTDPTPAEKKFKVKRKRRH
jgi:hypothetical protein